MEELLEAVLHGEQWLDGFTRYSYRETFSRYRLRFSDVFLYAAKNTPSDELSSAFIEGIEASIKKAGPFKRGAHKVNIKMMMVSFLGPMLLSLKEPACTELAEGLCSAWNRRWPGDEYGVSDYETILNGFRHSIMGIDMEGKHLN